jgi:hypothetical protein
MAEFSSQIRQSEQARPRCLRCKTQVLAPLESPESIAFFECPGCHRQYARKADGALVFRWRHPITLLLYPVIFDERPMERCASVAATFERDQSKEMIQAAIDEVRLELDEPRQPLRETLDCRATEEELRAFLHCVAERLKAENKG